SQFQAEKPRGKQKLALIARVIQGSALRELREHPGANVRIELSAGTPEQLENLLREVAGTQPRLSYVVRED
ncbi:MAG: hypothetical protein KGJ86_05825, partial [Chloroflexota bacterium]|nr:hypothetical protein [Chloroflexota bacterium]